VDSRVSTPVDKAAEDAAVAEAGKDRSHPGLIEGEEFGIRHLARSHAELAMAAARHMPGDRDIIRFVGEDQPRGRVAPDHLAEGLRISCAAANDPVGTEVKNVANAGDGDCAGAGRDRPLLHRCISRVESDVIDLVEREARDLDRRIGENQLQTRS
jgi:hypothetical protein